MAWPFSIPEMRPLPPESRRKVVNAWLGSGVVVHFFLLAMMLVGGCVFFFFTTLVMIGVDSAASAGLVAIVFAAAASGAALFLCSIVRKSLCDFARDYTSSLHGTICLACGYDLRGNRGGTCPECGEWLDYTSVGTSPRQGD